MLKMEQAIETYNTAKEFVLARGYENEILWQEGLISKSFTEKEFLQETAWVILCSGFRESAVRKVFNYISLCFCDWQSSNLIIENSKLCYDTALEKFKNKRKIEAIVNVAQKVVDKGFFKLKEQLLKEPIQTLLEFPFVGPITVWHLMKNLGLPVAKPDRHLVRIANIFGYEDVQEFCTNISQATGDKVPVVDIVFWRFAAIENEYLEIIKAGIPSNAFQYNT